MKSPCIKFRDDVEAGMFIQVRMKLTLQSKQYFLEKAKNGVAPRSPHIWQIHQNEMIQQDKYRTEQMSGPKQRNVHLGSEMVEGGAGKSGCRL